jgi:hypothetical protein
VWDGGPAYLDLETPGRTIARGWLVTPQQFDDVLAQENHLEPGSVTIDRALLSQGGVVFPSSRYGRLVPLGHLEGRPAVTFTYVARPPVRAPDPAYVAMLHSGLRELGYSSEQAAAYLASATAIERS